MPDGKGARAVPLSSEVGPTPPKENTDLLPVVLLGIIWGSAFPVIRFGIVSGVPPLVFASVRYALTAVVLWTIALASRAPRPAVRSLISPAVFGGLFIIGGYGGLLYLGEVSTSGGLAAILTASAPLMSALLGFGLLPADRLGTRGSVGMLIGFGGVAVLVLPQLASPLSSGFEGPVLVVAAVLVFSLGSVLLRRRPGGSPGFVTLAVQFSTAAILLGGVGVALGEPIVLGNGFSVLLALAYLVVFPGIIGYTLYFRIHHRSGPTRANLVGYINPVTGVLIGLLLFGETVTALELVGMALIAAGLFLLQRDRAPPRTEAEHSRREPSGIPRRS